jgi:hypothetical protein
MPLPQTPQPCSVPRYERTTLHTPHKLSDLQADILLLCGSPHTLTHILTSLQAIHQRPHLYCDIWLEITKLRKHGLLVMYPPILAGIPTFNLPTLPNYQSRRLAA